MIDNHKVELDKTKEEYTKLKKAMDELRASEVCNLNPVIWWCHNSAVLFLSTTLCVWPKKQVDAEYKWQDTIKLAKEWEMKLKTFKKRLDEIQTNVVKHMDQYV